MASTLHRKSARLRNAAIFVVVVVVWLALDQFAKSCFGAYDPGEVIAGPFLGIFQIELVHNTGAAWGIFSDMTFALGIFSVCVCVLSAAYLFAIAPDSSIGATVGLALVVAGGLGNAIDRFANGYVVDFINATFIDFPVFNIADIGVTCGVVLFVASIVFETIGEARKESDINEGDAK